MIRKFTYFALPMALGALLATILLSNFGVGQTRAAPDAELYQQLGLFGDVFERVREEYVEEPSTEAMIETAIDGMLSSLDPHSSYLSAEDFEDMQVNTKGEFGGLGIEVTMEDGLVKVVSPIAGSPADEVGVQAGDLIFEIDGEAVRGMTLNDAVNKMRGKIGTDIQISVFRENIEGPLDFTITRDNIKIRAVRYHVEETDDSQIGYVSVSQFTEQTLIGITEAFESFDKEIDPAKLKGYILDLRGNPGGLLDQAIAVSDAFLERGEIVSTRGRQPSSIDRHDAREGDISHGKPVVVLINGGSASASEIVAGALQDQERATIVGTRSFGKGSVQTIIPIGPNGAIRLTTARYYTPSGTSIQAKGIEPDIRVVQDVPDELKDRLRKRSESSLRGHLSATDEEEQEGSFDYVPKEKEKDNQLQHALKLLRGEIEDEKFIAKYEL